MIYQSEAEALDVFLAGRTVIDALSEECRVAQLADERLCTSPDGTAVYLLVDRFGHIIYIGHSRAWRDRAGSHVGGWIGRITDHVRVISLLDRPIKGASLEAALIDIFQPPYNKVGTSHGLNLPQVVHDLEPLWIDGQYVQLPLEDIEASRLAWQSSHPPTFPPTTGEAAA